MKKKKKQKKLPLTPIIMYVAQGMAFDFDVSDLTQHMTPNQIVSAQELARRWYCPTCG